MAKKKSAPKSKPVKKKAAPKAKRKTAPKKVKKSPVRKAAPRAARKKAAAPAPALPWREALPGETLVGVVEDFYGHVSVIALTLRAALKVGDKIHVRGHTTDMTETVDSMQIDHAPVASAAAGDAVGVRAVVKCRTGDYVYRVG